MFKEKSLFVSLLMIVGVVLLLSFLIGIIVNLLPYIVLAVVAYYFYRRYKDKQTVKKWYEGTSSDSFYEKIKRKEDENIVDVKVNSRRIDDD